MNMNTQISFDELKQLSRSLIAMNANRNGNKGTITSTLLDYYKELVKQPWLAQLVAAIREGKDPKQVEMLKKQLPFRSPHYFHFLDDHRAQKSIDPESFTFQTTIDIDNPEEVEQAVSRALQLNEQQGGMWQGKVLHVERSARNKAHIDIRIPVGKTIAEAQADFCKELGVTEDTSCITPERIIFITDQASEIYTAPDWYRRLSDEEIAERREAYRQRGLDIDGRPLQGASHLPVASSSVAIPSSASSRNASSSSSGNASSSDHASSSSDHIDASSAEPISSVDFEPLESEEEKARRMAQQMAEQSKYEQTFEGVPYEEIVKALVDEMGGAPAHGFRNNFIYKEACYLRYICNDDPEWIKQVIDIFGEDEKKAFATVDSACKQNHTAEMPYDLKQAIAKARKRYIAQQATEKAGIYSELPPQLPAKLPKLIKLLTSKVPADFKPAVAMSVFPSLAAHLKDVSFRGIDNQWQEAALMGLLVAPMSSGKSLVNGPIKCIIEDILERDAISRKKEQEWKDAINSLGDNKSKPTRPADLCVQVLPTDMTRAAYIQRLDEAQKAGGKYLYCCMDEVDMLKNFNRDYSGLIRLAHNNGDDGADRVGTKSVTAMVKTRFNWNASTTIGVAQSFFPLKLVNNGTVSRLCLSTIIRDDFAPRPKVGEYDAVFKAMLRPYIDNLNNASGQKDCKKARLLAERLDNEARATAELADNKAYAEFAKRSVDNALRMAMVLYLANGEKWEKPIEDFIEWTLKYDLWCKMRFFGNMMAEALEGDTRNVSHTGPTNLLVFVPDTFRADDLRRVYMQQGKKGNLSALLNMWQKRGHIQKNMDGTYSKTEAFVLKYGHYGAPVAA